MARFVQLCSAMLIAVLLLSNIQISEQANIFAKDLSRAARSATENKTEICSSNTVCGWAIYKPFTRQIESFVKNPCECPDNTQCVRTSEDLAISAYEYKCNRISEPPVQ